MAGTQAQEQILIEWLDEAHVHEGRIEPLGTAADPLRALAEWLLETAD